MCNELALYAATAKLNDLAPQGGKAIFEGWVELAVRCGMPSTPYVQRSDAKNFLRKWYAMLPADRKSAKKEAEFEAKTARKKEDKALRKRRKKARKELGLSPRGHVPLPQLAQMKASAQFKVQTSYAGDVNSAEFLNSYEWRRLRVKVLMRYGRRCMCCGATPENGAVMHVDHIKPRRLFPQLALDEDNLQVLCHECNHGKGNWLHEDFRPTGYAEDDEHSDASVISTLREIAAFG